MSVFSILFGIFLFSLLIFIHELGHFLAAKTFGVQVNEFSMFMGPVLWKKQKGETLYSLRLILPRTDSSRDIRIFGVEASVSLVHALTSSQTFLTG